MAVSKKTGKKSLAANDFLIPLPPGPPTANDVGTNRPFDNGSAVVGFSPVDLAVSYKIYAASAGQTTVTATGATSPIIITGLKSNILYTFTVTGFNSEGVEGAPSDPSTATLITTVPATPAAPGATSPNANQDVVTWLAPATGGKTITGYIWTASDGKTNLSGGNPGGGQTANLSVTVSQEAGSAQTYRVYAINANGNSSESAASASITTTFSFAPFGAFGFSPFGAFGFSPFKAFGFSPFKAFGFSPFGFSPFKAFGFSPFICIASNTKIATISKKNKLIWVKAKDISIGTKVFTPVWDEFKGDEIENPYDSIIKYDNLSNLRLETGEVRSIKKKVAEETIYFNGNIEKRFSMTQPILAIKDGELVHSWVFAGQVVPGDIIWEYSFNLGIFQKTIIEKTDIISKDEYVYAFDIEDIDTFIAGDVICHNRRKV
jgi:hypothetical protein